MEYTAYSPAPGVLERLKSVTLVAVIGPTAVGKSTLINAAIARDPHIHLVLNNTSRDPRPGERDGIDYIFRKREDMLADMKKGLYVQVAPSVFGDLYATAADGYAIDGVAVMAILADAMPDFRALPFKKVRSIFVLPPDYASWEARIMQHGFSPERLKGRLIEAERSLVYAVEDKEIRFVINESLNVACEDFVTLACGDALSTRQQADQSRAREIVRNLLEKLRDRLERA